MVGVSTGIEKGWTIYGADGGKIGEVDEVHPTYLKLRKGFLFKKDVYVPTAAISRLRGDEVHLSAREGDVDALGWDTPPGPAGGGPPRPWVTVERIPHDAQLVPLIERVFSREVLRIPVRAEEVSVEKRPVISGEVAVTREQTTERTRVEASVRKLSVEVEEHYQRARPGFQEHFEARRQGRGARAGRTFADAEPHYRAGYAAGRDERYAGQAFEQAEPSLRRDYATSGSEADSAEEQREEIREGWRRARGE